MITQVELLQIINYNPNTGIFTWIISPRNGINVGDKVGSIDDNGYIIIRIKRKAYKAHRLAFLYMTGKWPEEFVDHIDKNRSNNKWENLREATNQQNQFNSKCHIDNKLNLKGIVYSYGKYRVTIRRKHIGLFYDLNEAKEAYENAAKQYYGEFNSK